ncbi:MAG TPA: oligosaccharide flippase family protein [Polyangia bacterium]|nr:oligosaccharide flippase family protein [Polyangia bacterium]
MGHAKTIARNSLWSLADSVLGLISSFGCSIAVARVMGPDQLGYYNIVTWMANMAGWIAAFGIPAATRTFAAEAIGKGDYGLARAIVKITFRIQLYLALAAVAVGLAVVFWKVPPEQRTFAILAVVSILPFLMFTIPSAGIIATEDLAPNVRASLVSTVVVGGGTALSLVAGWGLAGLAGAMLASRAVDFVLRQIFYTRIYSRFPIPAQHQKLPPELRRRVIQFCKQATFMTALEIVVWERSEVMFLQKFSTMAQVSFFSQPFNWVSQWLLLLPRIVSAAAGASIAVQQGRDPEQTAGLAIGSTRVITLITLPAAFGLSALASPVIRVLLGARYLPCISIFAVLAVVTLGKAIQLPARQLLTSTGRQHLLVWWGLAFCVINLGLDFALIPRYGAMGATIAKGIILLGGGLSIWWIVAASFRVRLPLAHVARMTLASIGMFVLVRMMTALVPPLVALIVGPPIGIVAIIVLYRVLRCLDPADREILAALGRKLPARTRGAWVALVEFMFPRGAAPGQASGTAA